MGKTKVLLVDDNIKFVKNVSRYLKLVEPTYEIYTTGIGEEGLKILEKEKPNIMLCDLFMLDMDGDEVIKKAQSISPNTVFIILTAYTDDKIVERLKKIGANDIIYKPIEDLDSFVSRLKGYLNPQFPK